MSNITDFRNIKTEKLNKEIEYLDKVHEEATEELETLLARMDLKNNNGKESSDDEILALFAGIGKVAKATKDFGEACKKLPNYKPICEEIDIVDKVNEVMHGHVIPAFVPDDELDPYFN